MDREGLRVKALLIGVAVGDGPGAGASMADALGWHRLLRKLGMDPVDIRMVAARGGAGAGALCQTRRDDLAAARDWLADADHALVAVSGPGGITTDGREALVLAEGPVALSELVPPHLGRVDWFLDLCRTEATPGDSVPPIGHVAHWSCAPGQTAAQRCIAGQWRGVWTWAVHRVLEQWAPAVDARGQRAFAIDHGELAHRAAAMLRAIGEDGQHSGVLGDQGLLSGAVGPGRVAPRSRPTAPVATREIAGGWGIILDANDDCVFGIQILDGVAKIRFASTASSSGDLPAEGMLVWRSPSSAELAQLGSVAISCTNQTFSSVGAGPSATGGRLYSSEARKLWLRVKSDLSEVAWYTESGELDQGYLLTPDEDPLVTLSSTPSTPGGGFYRAVDS